jgi:hypothetical protein
VEQVADVRALPAGRHVDIDERGVGLRLSWHLDHGFVNLSLWRDDRCVETFHLSPGAAAEVVSFLVRGLADASKVGMDATVRHLRAVASVPSTADRARASIAGVLDRIAHAIRP